MKTKSMAFVGVLFAVSGMCGLVYEVVWAKYLALFIGNTTYAQTVVLASFMGGLMLGSFAMGRVADRTSDRLRVYAFLELGIGLYGLVFPFVLRFLESLYLAGAISLNLTSTGFSLSSLRFLVSALAMIVPTFLMGGTLPVLVKFLSTTARGAGKTVALLYSINSLGAIVGAGLAGFVLIREWGLFSTQMVAATTNILVGFIALSLSRARRRMPDGDPGIDSGPERGKTYSKGIMILALLTAGVSGLVSMIYELTWVRFLSPVFGSSTYSFSLMLVAFISGITLGSFLVSRFIEKVRSPVAFLAVSQLACGLSLLLTLPFYERLPYLFWEMASIVPKTPGGFTGLLVGEFAFCFLMMAVPVTFLGMSLPIAARLAGIRWNILGRAIGDVFAVNTFGTVLGAVATGLVLIPAVGIRHGIEIGIVLNILLGVLLMYSERGSSRGKTAVLAIVGVACIGYRMFVPGWNANLMTAGVFRSIREAPPASYGEFKEQYSARRVLFYKEGLHANVAVVLSQGPGGVEKSLIINGKPDASTIVDLSTQILSAQLPLLLRPDTGNVLVIGLGSGVTVGSVLTHPVRRVDCVEISPEVVEASSFFAAENGNCLANPRVRLQLEDACSFLKLTSCTYDLIVSEPSNPWIAGIGNLFSAEYFEECRRKLSRSGVMMQWFHTYDMDDEVFQMVVHTFASVFPNVVMFHPGVGDILLLGAREPVQLDLQGLERRMGIPEVKKDLERMYVPDVPTLLSLQMTSEQTMRVLSSHGALNTEDRPLLEYLSPRGMFTGSEVTSLNDYDERRTPSRVNLWLHSWAAERPLKTEECVNIAVYHLNWTVRDIELGSLFLKQALVLSPHNPDVEYLLAQVNRIMQK